MITEMTRHQKGLHDRGVVGLPTPEQELLFSRTDEVRAAPTVKVRPADTVTRLRSLQKLNLMKVSTGLYRVNTGDRPPVLLIARTEERADGVFELVPAYEQWVRLTHRIAVLLGINSQHHTIYRLGKAGFVEIAPISPHTPMLNLPTWWGHLANVIEDPQFWDPETKKGRERLELYRRTIR